eukprot:1421545-Rhodomonas_salina.1
MTHKRKKAQNSRGNKCQEVQERSVAAKWRREEGGVRSEEGGPVKGVTAAAMEGKIRIIPLTHCNNNVNETCGHSSPERSHSRVRTECITRRS